MTDELRHVYSPRSHFVPFHQRTKRWSVLVCHRRMGKTVAAVNDLVARALYTTKKNARYAYLAPYYRQAKEIAWQYLKDATRDGLAKRISEAELSVTLINDAKITLFGADNPDALRGIYLDGVILDEFGDMRPSLWGEAILPTLADRKGWAVLMGTPKGRNQFYHAYEKAKNSNDWFSLYMPASRSGVLDEEALAEMKAQMSDDAYAQEFECDFSAAVSGTYYSKLIVQLENEGRITDEELYDPTLPVFCASDIGRKDGTAWWFWQEPPQGGVHFFDYEENHGLGAEENIELLQKKGYLYRKVWLPHDARAKTFQTSRSTLELFLEAGFPCDITPKLSRQDGIEAARLVLRDMARIHKSRCALGVEALRFYHREWSEVTKSFADNPAHDWASEGADAFRYSSLVCKQKRFAEVAQVPEGFRQKTSKNFNLDNLFADHQTAMRYKRIEM